MSAELTLSSDLTTLTAEIHAYKRVAGEAIFEIGRRLKHVKEHDLAHGQWERWCRAEIGFDPSTARKFIVVCERIPITDQATWHDLGWRTLYEIATLPPEERTCGHTLKSGETKTPNEMTVRELREVKAALKAEREAREEAEQQRDRAVDDYETVRDTLESISVQPPRVEYVADPEMSERLKRYEVRYGDLDGEVIDRIANQTEVSGAAAHFSDDVQTLLLNYAHLPIYRANFGLADESALREYDTTVSALEEFTRKMRAILEDIRTRGQIVIEI